MYAVYDYKHFAPYFFRSLIIIIIISVRFTLHIHRRLHEQRTMKKKTNMNGNHIELVNFNVDWAWMYFHRNWNEFRTENTMHFDCTERHLDEKIVFDGWQMSEYLSIWLFEIYFDGVTLTFYMSSICQITIKNIMTFDVNDRNIKIYSVYFLLGAKKSYLWKFYTIFID